MANKGHRGDWQAMRLESRPQWKEIRSEVARCGCAAFRRAPHQIGDSYRIPQPRTASVADVRDQRTRQSPAADPSTKRSRPKTPVSAARRSRNNCRMASPYALRKRRGYNLSSHWKTFSDMGTPEYALGSGHPEDPRKTVGLSYCEFSASSRQAVIAPPLRSQFSIRPFV
jgi:hypothetical protein